MTSSLLTPCGRTRPRTRAGAVPVLGETAPTRILDWGHPRVSALVGRVTSRNPEGPLDLLRIAHGVIARTVRPVYSVKDLRPVSETLRRGRGSCSQRLAVLEAVARASGVPTRVRGLLVDGAMWYPRFPRLRLLVPDRVVLAWPEFRLADGWLQASELFGGLDDLSRAPGGGFANDGGETLFEALSRTAVDWDGVTSPPGACSVCDLSARVLTDLGRHRSRDALFAEHGQTLCWAARTLAEPLLGRWSAGADLPR
ncbi:transglutaminase domain-containing protein [Streptosporangium carneum]|uniref:transglutaminase domain-containing protein n=1 Tax=Streptosporangium carneum TaxID=47481 RepID=UPI0022F2EAA9|nr:transglutaminase domain-containing protein [Streptosporangium carneum]